MMDLLPFVLAISTPLFSLQLFYHPWIHFSLSKVKDLDQGRRVKYKEGKDIKENSTTHTRPKGIMMMVFAAHGVAAHGFNG